VSQERIAVIVPCYNEEPTIRKVVTEFRAVLPGAAIYVIDNNSEDRTADIAVDAGATVLKEKRQGKGEVLKGVCAEIDADYFILVDGDDTYPAEDAVRLLEPLIRDEADMVIGSRRSAYDGTAPPPFHRSGNEFVCFLVNRIFGSRLTDVMSGYRAFTWRVARSLPIISIGFDVETEMTIQMLYRRYVLKEVPVEYRKRPPASISKLRTFRDGFRVLLKIVVLLVAYKPLTVFGVLSLASGLAGGALIAHGLWRHASASGTDLGIGLGTAGLLAAVLFLSLGLTISSVNWRVRELESLFIKLVGRPFSEGSGLGRERVAIGADDFLKRRSHPAAADHPQEE
jgi:glycosyltransferase involved in cell wall biosynthesis